MKQKNNDKLNDSTPLEEVIAVDNATNTFDALKTDKKTNKSVFGAAKQKRLQKKQLRIAAKQDAIDKAKAIKKLDPIDEEINKIAEQQHLPQRWFKLDNAALIYPAAAQAGFNTVFRVAVVLKQAVDPIALQKALNIVVPRFPTMAAVLRKGIFWYYFESSTKPFIVHKLDTFACSSLDADAKQQLIRITYFGHEVALEMFHSVTDGIGAVTFINTLIAQYIKVIGGSVTIEGDTVHPLDIPKRSETDDAFKKIADKSKKVNINSPKSFKIKGEQIEAKNAVVHTHATFASDQLYKIAKTYNATITQFLTACLFISASNIRKATAPKNKKPIVIDVPTNLRKLFNIKTMRNCSSYFVITATGNETFEEVLAIVKDAFAKQSTVENLRGSVNFNVGFQNNFFIKFLPLILKDKVLGIVFRASSGGHIFDFSNLGIIKAPREFNDYVYKYVTDAGRQAKGELMITTATFNNVSTLSIARSTYENPLEKEFFRMLANIGVDLVIDSDIDPRLLPVWQDTLLR